MNKPKKQSQKVTKRIEEFEIKRQAHISEGYKEEKLLINIVFANIFAMIMIIPIAAIFIVALFMGFFENAEIIISFPNLLIFIIISFVLIFLHEFLHGFIWSFFTKDGWKSIEFGVIWKYFTPYCTCKVSLKKYQYILGGIMPLILLGIIPMIISLIIGSVGLFLLGGLMIIGGGGDILIVRKIISHKLTGTESIYIDHPSECGLVVFEK